MIVITFTVEGKGDLGKVNFPGDRLRKSPTVIYEVQGESICWTRNRLKANIPFFNVWLD